MGTEHTIPEALLTGLRKAIAKAGMTDRADLILPHARPCISIRRTPVATDDIRASDSFFGGGVAYVPAGFDWPMAGSWALEPIARIRLSEASRFDLSGLLPTTGFLTFWYDQQGQPSGLNPEDRDGFLVTYVADEDAKLERRRPPNRVSEWRKLEEVVPACRLSFKTKLSLPDWEEFPEGHPFRVGDDYFDVVAALSAEPCHRLLGHPRLIQGPMQEECQDVFNVISCGRSDGEGESQELQAGAADWQLLLQLDTDEAGPGWMWGDVGRLYFWIRKQDLARADFSKCWQIQQCC